MKHCDEKIDSKKCLGVQIDTVLSLKHYMDMSFQKTERDLGMPRRAVKDISRQVCKATVQCVGLPIYGLWCMMDCTMEQGEGPQKLCNMGIKTVLHEHPTAPWHAKLHWPTLQQCRKLLRLKVVHRCVHGKFYVPFPQNMGWTQRHTRSPKGHSSPLKKA